MYLDKMEIDVAQTLTAMMPYVTSALNAYGTNTLDKVRDSVVDGATDATVGVGHKILNRLLGRAESRAAIEDAVTDVAAGEEDSEAALRLQIRKALNADFALAQELQGMMPAGSVRYEASGTGSIAIGTNSGIANTGANAIFNR